LTLNRILTAKLGTETITQVPNHTHGVNITSSTGGAHTHTFPGWASSGSGTRVVDTALPGSTSTYTTSSSGAHSHSVIGNTAGNAGGVPSVDNLQPSLVLNYIIKL
jgi:microcystin-dependent protein